MKQNSGDYFKALREANNFTLREVDKRTDISNSYLSQLEQGKILQPSPHALKKLADLYGVSYELLMEKVGYPVISSSSVDKKTNAKSISYRIGTMTDEEEIELINYLNFIRNKKK